MVSGPNYGYYGEQKKRFNGKVVLIILGGIVLIIAAIVLINVFNGRNSVSTQAAHLSVRLGNLDTLTKNAAPALRSGTLQKINAETALITSGVEANLATTLPKKVDKSVAAAESDTTDTTKLSNAALAGTYDQTYTTVLTAKLESVNALLTEMYNRTNSRSLRASLNTDYKNYAAILKELSAVTP